TNLRPGCKGSSTTPNDRASHRSQCADKPPFAGAIYDQCIPATGPPRHVGFSPDDAVIDVTGVIDAGPRGEGGRTRPLHRRCKIAFRHLYPAECATSRRLAIVNLSTAGPLPGSGRGSGACHHRPIPPASVLPRDLALRVRGLVAIGFQIVQSARR